jgi:hypothetical protein
MSEEIKLDNDQDYKEDQKRAQKFCKTTSDKIKTKFLRNITSNSHLPAPLPKIVLIRNWKK